MKIRAACLVATVVLLAISGAACGGDGDDDASATPSPEVTATVTAVAPAGETPPALTEFKVAFINLYSPLTLDPTNAVAGGTFDARMGILVDELRRFNPDLIAFNEASITTHGNAIQRLVAELKMEFHYVRANPWFPGQSKEQSDATVKDVGYEEGELIFSRHPIIDADPPIALNPRTSEAGERRVLLHVVVKAPAPLNELDVFVTHLTGGGDKVREAQATDIIQHIRALKSERPALLIGDMGDPAGSPTYKVFRDAGFSDPGWESDIATCCRESVVGEQKALTSRPDCIMSRGFASGSAQLFAQHPVTRPDGSKLYASDHNGLFAVFSLSPG